MIIIQYSSVKDFFLLFLCVLCRYLLDTNAIVALLQGNLQLLQLLQNADWIGISIISQIEFLAFSVETR